MASNQLHLSAYRSHFTVTDVMNAISGNKFISIDCTLMGMGRKGARKIAHALIRNTRLQTFNIGDNTIRDEGVVEIAAALQNNSTLTELNLSNVRLRPTGVGSIADLLSKNFTLRSLNLAHNCLGQWIISPHHQIESSGAMADLARGLRINRRLSSLILTGTQIDDKGAISLAEVLGANSSLTYLDLSNNRITNIGSNSLATALGSNSILISLDLSWNQIKNPGAVSLAEALKLNSRLQSLNLKSNQIEDVGAVAVATALRSNSNLLSLDLSGNTIGGGYSFLAILVSHNFTLQSIIMPRVRSELGQDGFEIIESLLRTNSALTAIDLGYIMPACHCRPPFHSCNGVGFVSGIGSTSDFKSISRTSRIEPNRCWGYCCQ